MTEKWKIGAALAAVYVIWGSTYLAIAIAIETMPPFWMAGVRFVVAGALLYGLARLTGAARPVRVHWRSATLIGALLLLGGNGGVVWAEQRVDSGLAALLVSTVPLWMVLLQWLRGVRPSGGVLAGVAVGFAGLVMLVRPGNGHGGIDPLGVVVLMVGCLSWAWGSLHSRRVSLPASPLMATALEMITGGALLLVAGAMTGEPARLDLAAVSMRSALALGYLVLIGALVGFTAYIWLLRVASPTVVSTYAYVNPIVAVFLGWLIRGEPLTGSTLAAAAVIVTGVALITSAKAPQPQAEPKPVREMVEGEEEEAEQVCLAEAS